MILWLRDIHQAQCLVVQKCILYALQFLHFRDLTEAKSFVSQPVPIARQHSQLPIVMTWLARRIAIMTLQSSVIFMRFVFDALLRRRNIAFKPSDGMLGIDLPSCGRIK